MADGLVENGVKVIAVGRRQERLVAFVKKHGSTKAASIRFCITDRAGLDDFVKRSVTGAEICCPQSPRPFPLPHHGIGYLTRSVPSLWVDLMPPYGKHKRPTLLTLEQGC